MKTCVLLLLLLSSVCLAQEKTVGEAIVEKGKAIKEFVLGSDCEQFLKRAKDNTAYSIISSRKKDWDSAFYFDEQAFFSIIGAISYCETEPEKFATANDFLREHYEISEKLTCAFHDDSAFNFLAQAKKSVEENDFKEALFNLDWGTYHLDEAIERCNNDQRKIELLEVKGHTYKFYELIKKQLDGH